MNMDLASILALFVSGVALLLISSKSLVEESKKLAIGLKLSPLFISLLIVALGTNLPELTVLISALVHNDSGLAFGNTVGSNISNISLIFGAGVILYSPRIGTVKTQKNSLIMLFLTIIFVLMEFLPVNSQVKGLSLLLFLVIFLLYEYVLAREGQSHEDKRFFKTLNKKTLNVLSKRKSKIFTGLTLIGAAIGLAIGSNLVVTSMETMSSLLGISTTLLGATLVATTTSLPELLTIIIAGAKKEDKIVLGTLIGSNIYNISLFVPIIQFSPFPAKLKVTDLLFLLIITAFFSFTVFRSRGKKVPRIYGLIFIALYIAFLYTTIRF